MNKICLVPSSLCLVYKFELDLQRSGRWVMFVLKQQCQEKKHLSGKIVYCRSGNKNQIRNKHLSKLWEFEFEWRRSVNSFIPDSASLQWALRTRDEIQNEVSKVISDSVWWRLSFFFFAIPPYWAFERTFAPIIYSKCHQNLLYFDLLSEASMGSYFGKNIGLRSLQILNRVSVAS